nr:hypothetical protein [Tanacetum cinerariifolium]
MFVKSSVHLHLGVSVSGKSKGATSKSASKSKGEAYKCLALETFITDVISPVTSKEVAAFAERMEFDKFLFTSIRAATEHEKKGVNLSDLIFY